MTRIISLLFLVFRSGSSVQYPGAMRVYPISSGGVNLDDLQVKDQPPVRVWSVDSMVNFENQFHTDRSPWKNYSPGQPDMNCTGYLRYGDGQKFTAPIMSVMPNTTCSAETVKNYLWSAVTTVNPPQCQCRQPLAMQLTQQFQGKIRCLSLPSGENGWPAPGLIDCSEYAPLVATLVYHRLSGQIRWAGRCLTAQPYSTSRKSEDLWKPWSITWAPCSNMYETSKRQSWDVPAGAGLPAANLGLSSQYAFLGRPSGRTGKITLRDSGDIGQRCLDVSYSPTTLSVKVQGVFLEAPLCDDARVNSGDKSMWRFFESGLPPTAADAIDIWKNCGSTTCMECSDGEIRAGLDNSFTHGVSVPGDFQLVKPCTMDVLKSMVLPGDIPNGKCHCQAQNLFLSSGVTRKPNLSFMVTGSADDLPITQFPSFPPRNSTKSGDKF